MSSIKASMPASRAARSKTSSRKSRARRAKRGGRLEGEASAALDKMSTNMSFWHPEGTPISRTCRTASSTSCDAAKPRTALEACFRNSSADRRSSVGVAGAPLAAARAAPTPPLAAAAGLCLEACDAPPGPKRKPSPPAPESRLGRSLPLVVRSKVGLVLDFFQSKSLPPFGVDRLLCCCWLPREGVDGNCTVELLLIDAG
mmetsp:Transcript_133401/g.345324  ORF Transcript_133401/g.345324 Transcript_133401/m.345324 type:complete len:201 (+) Transcript_133401:196-798(+)